MIKLENTWADLIETMEVNMSECPYEGAAIIMMFLQKWLDNKCPGDCKWILHELCKVMFSDRLVASEQNRVVHKINQ